MNDSRLNTVKDIEQFLTQAHKITFVRKDQKQAYEWIEDILVKFNYICLAKKEKSVIKQYIAAMTHYSRAQITRLITSYVQTGGVEPKSAKRHSFPKRYSIDDIRILVQTDKLHNYPNGYALKRILIRMHTVFSDKKFENISQISPQHIYNLRKSVYYRKLRAHYEKTKPTVINIGIRKKPSPKETPGYLRVDSVHQGREPGYPGAFHINTIDEVVQWEIIGAVKELTREHIKPLLKIIINAYPFIIKGFHADNGSEFINYQIAQMLNKLLIELTKSRPRHCNDNALVESKNGSIIRKWLGYDFIPDKAAYLLNRFYLGSFNEYLNFHRPCAFATEIRNEKGKIKKTYKPQDYITPYEKFRSIKNCEQFLKPNVSLKQLYAIALRISDNEMANLVKQQRSILRKKLIAFST